jgi:transglutaminase-like putative cysteine protease
MKFELRYRTVFTYDDLAIESQNELRACPTSDETQRLLDYRVTVEPKARVYSFVDAWGTRVDSFGVRRPHKRMEVTAEASVETHPRPLPGAAPRMASLLEASFVDNHIFFLQRDRNTDYGRGVEQAAARQVDIAGDDVVSTVLAVHRFVRTALEYVPGATEVGIEVEDVLAGGVGVCQDHAHLAVAMCRSLGIPARYVSGYLFTDDDSTGGGTDADTVVVQTHAWFEAAVPGWGWLSLDPTNGRVVGERHVKIGHGRSYDDVQPLRGVFLGPDSSEVHPLVEIRRLGGEDIWRATHAHVGPGSVPTSMLGAVPRPPRPLGTIRQQQLQQQQWSPGGGGSAPGARGQSRPVARSWASAAAPVMARSRPTRPKRAPQPRDHS